MRAGQLDKLIEIQQRVERNSSGEVVWSWVELAEVWARRLPTGAAERVLGRELVSEESVTWSIRYRSDVSPKMRLVYDGRAYRIEGVHEGGRGRKRELILLTVLEQPERGE